MKNQRLSSEGPLHDARGVETGEISFATAFGRGVDYYTGFEFELQRKDGGDEPLIAGGRYDGLMTQLGATTPIPAVGFSIWIEAVTRCAGKASTSRTGGS